MNDMEERLRAAFDAQARTYEPDPHAWARIMERRPRRRPARWLLAALPVALLTVFVPVLLNGGLGRNSAIDPTGVYQQLMKERIRKVDHGDWVLLCCRVEVHPHVVPPGTLSDYLFLCRWISSG